MVWIIPIGVVGPSLYAAPFPLKVPTRDRATSFRQLIPRMAALLLERADGDSVRGLTHQVLAQHLRVYRKSATAALGEMRRAGIISVGRKQIRILRRARLERAAL